MTMPQQYTHNWQLHHGRGRLLEGRRFIGIEREAVYAAIAHQRLAAVAQLLGDMAV